MRKRFFFLALVFLILGFVAWTVRTGPGREPDAPALVERETATTAVAPDLSTPAPEVTTSQRTSESIPLAPAAEQVAPHESTTSTLAEVRGRLLFEDGTPAAGVPLRVRGFGGNQERVMKFGEPQDWKEPTMESLPDGRFGLRFDPPRAYQFYLDAKLAGFATASWRWNQIEPGEVKDLGDVVLARGGSIRGRILDARGKPQIEGWMVYADGGTRDMEGGRQQSRARGPVDPATGSYLLEDLPPGPAGLKAHSRIANWIDGPTVTVRPGDVVEADIPYTGPDNSRRISVSVSTRPFFIFSFDDELGPLMLTGNGGTPRTATKVANSSQLFSFENLDPGSYSVQVDDPRFLPWRQDGVAPGTSLDAKLVGNAAVRLAVTDAISGAPVPAWSLDVRFDGRHSSPNEFRVLESGKEPPVGGLFQGLVPHDLTLTVRSDGYAPCEVAVPGLTAHETRDAQARLTRGLRIAGFVRASAVGPGVVDATVTLGPRREKSTDGMNVTYRESDLRQKSAQSDADGRFAFEQVPPGVWIVEAKASPFVRSQREIDAYRPWAATIDVVLELPPTARLTGRVIAPTGSSFDGLKLLVVPPRQEHGLVPDWRWAAESEAGSTLETDGTYSTGLLPAGTVEASIELPMVMVPMGRSSSMGIGGGKMVLESLDLAPGENRRDFDLSARFPGALDLTVTLNGEGAAGCVVEARSVEPVGFSGALVLDDRGRGVMRPLAGGSYRLFIRPPDNDWSSEHPAPWLVPHGSAAAAVIDVRIVEGRLRLNDASGTGIANADFGLASEGAEWPSRMVRTNADGDQLKLAPGRYKLWRGSGSGPEVEVAGFEWASTGPSPAVLAIPQ